MTVNRAAVIANLRSNSHFLLERKPALASSLEELGVEILWFCIYDLKAKSLSTSIKDSTKELRVKLQNVQVVFAHKECLEFLTMDFFNTLPCVASLGFLGDEEWQMGLIANYLPMFDIATVYTSKALTSYSSYGYRLMHLPVGGIFHSRGQTSPIQDIDVIFVGRPYGRRVMMIKELIAQGIHVHVYGSQEWKKRIPSDAYKGYLNNKVYEATVARAKIVLGFMEAPNNSSVHINAKIFDAAKAKRFCLLTRYQPFYEDYGLVEGESIVTYDGVQDLCRKVKFYLDHPRERELIASKCSFILKTSANYILLYRNLAKNFFLDIRQSDFRTPMRHNSGWQSLGSGAVLASSELIGAICAINSDAAMIVLNTEGARRVIIKRLPITDADSVIIASNASRPPNIGGLVWTLGARRLPHFPLNRYEATMPFLVRILFCIETFLDIALTMYREKIRKIQPI